MNVARFTHGEAVIDVDIVLSSIERWRLPVDVDVDLQQSRTTIHPANPPVRTWNASCRELEAGARRGS